MFAQIPRGIGVAIRKRTSEINTGKQEYLWTGFTIIIPFLLLVYLLLTLFQPILNTYSSVTLSTSVLIALFFASTGFGSLEFSRYYLAGCSEPALAEKLRTMLAKTSMPLITVLLLSLNPTVEVALYSVFIAYFTTSLIIFGVSPNKFIKPKKETIIDVLQYSKWSLSTAILNDFYNRWDTLLLGIMVGAAALSYYDSSVRISFVATTLAVGISKTSNVKLSGMVESDQDITELSNKTITASTFLIFPLLIITIFNSEYLLQMLFGPEYTGAKLYLILLVITQIFQAYRMQFESVFNSSNEPRITTRASLLSVFINVITAPFLVLQFGGLGVLYSTIISEVFRIIVYERQVKKLLNKYLIPKGAIKQYISFVIISFIIFTIQYYFNFTESILLLISVAFATIGFYCIQYAISKQTREIIQEYKKVNI